MPNAVRSISASPSKENFFWMDLIRVIASFGVIMIHVAADVITEWGIVPKDWWWAAHLYDSLVRGCVPIFIMISGALLLPGNESLKDFFTKRIQRVLIPFLVWTVIFLIWRRHFYLHEMSFADALKRAFSNDVHFHLWFLYILSGLYLVTPIFRLFVQNAPARVTAYFIRLWFVMASLLPFIEQAAGKFFGVRFHVALPVEPAQGFIGYFVLGYFLHRNFSQGLAKAAAFVWFGSLLVCVLGSYYVTARFGGYQGIFYDNLAPNVVLYAAAFFVLMKAWGPLFEPALGEKGKGAVLNLAKASFGIYLIHPIFLEALIKGRWGFVLSAHQNHPVWTTPLTTLIVYLLSYAAVWGIQKIPYLRRIV